MLLFLKTLKTSIVIIFSFITFWITLTSCESYCDDKVGICINTNKVLAHSSDVAAQECAKDGSILLEIHDENYKEVIIIAIKNFGLRGNFLLFGLEYYNGQFHWRSSREVKVQLKGMDKFKLNTSCTFYLFLNGSQLQMDIGDCSGTPHTYFLCLKEKYYQSSTTSTISQLIPTNIATSNMFPTISNNNNNNQSPDDNYDQLNDLQKRNIGIGVGVTISLILIIVVVVVFGICFFRKRKHEDNTNVIHESKDIQKINYTNKTSSITKELSPNFRNGGMKTLTEISLNENHQFANRNDLDITEDEQVNTDYLEVIEDEPVNTDYLELIEDEQVNTDYLEVIEDENVYTVLAQDHHHYESLKVHK